MSAGIYKIKTFAALAGVSPTLLRAWERRYSLFSPSRQAGNQRLYSQTDLVVLQNVQKLLAQGLSIGEVAALGREKLLAPSTTLGKVEPAKAAHLMALAPELSVRRLDRYDGSDLGVSLARLAHADISTVHRLYGLVKGVYELWTYMERRTVPEFLLRRLETLNDPAFLQEVHALGAATRDANELVRAALQDTRRGALWPLLRLWQSTQNAQLVTTLARDHAKVMRNAFWDLDVSLRSADESVKTHDIDSFLRKVNYLVGSVSSDYQGPLTCCCLETSTVDRILYDMLNRAGEASALRVLRVGGMTRWVVEFAGSEFAPYAPEDLSTLAVSGAAGVKPAQALADGYLGQAEGSAWFHWPIYEPEAGLPSCQCEPLD